MIMFRQLVIIVHGLIPARDHLAMIMYAKWADMLYLKEYTGVLQHCGRVVAGALACNRGGPDPVGGCAGCHDHSFATEQLVARDGGGV